MMFRYYTIPFNSARGDGLDEIWTSVILRVDRGHLLDFGESISSAACTSSSSRCRTDPRVFGDLAKAIDLKGHVRPYLHSKEEIERGKKVQVPI